MTSADPIVAEFQRRSAVFQRLWARNILTIFFPGFATFSAGILSSRRTIVLVGFAVCAGSMARGVGILVKYRRCPACEHVVWPKKRYPNEWCRRCGVELSD